MLDEKGLLKASLDTWALRTNILLSYQYQLSMGETTLGYLKTIDRIVRYYIRTWLHLPGDCPNAYIHTSVKDGGLGVRACLWVTSLERVIRFRKLLEIFCESGRISDSFIGEHRSREWKHGGLLNYTCQWMEDL